MIKKDPKESKEDPAKSEGPISTRTEQKQVEERLAIGPQVVYETIRREGEEELQRTASSLSWSALAAGLSMGFSFIMEGIMRSHLPDEPWRPLITKFGYCIGFLIVVLGRQQLFTENTLTVVLPLLIRKDFNTFWRLLRLWAVVLSSNLFGTFLFALVLAKVGIFNVHVEQAFTQIGLEHMGAGFGIVIVRAIFAGQLLALMVWLLPGADSARVSIIILITYLIGISGFNHIIAGSTTMFYLIAIHSLSWGAYLTQFFLPTLLGNVIGGVSLVAALGHAQVVNRKEPKAERQR